MRDILRKIEEKTDFKEFSFEEMRIAKECYDAKLFEGVALKEMVSGRIIAEYRHESRLTLEGVRFLQAEEDLKAQKEAQRNEKANEESERKKDRKTQLLSAIAGAVITLFCEHIGQILCFIAKLLNQ